MGFLAALGMTKGIMQGEQKAAVKSLLFVLLLLFFCLWPIKVTYAGWTNLIYNYSRSDYGAGSQNWQIIQQNNNWMYFANKSGVLEFNGNDWKLYFLNNRSDVRAIQHSKDRIYLGGLNEFGYLKPDKTGKLSYVCMSDSLSKDQLFFGNIWEIYENEQTLYFIADKVVIKFVEGKFSSITASPDKISFANLIKGVLHVTTDSGIYVFISDQFYLLPGTDWFSGKKIRAIYPFENNLLIATASEGLFLLEDGKINKFETEVESFIRRNEIFSIAMNDKYIAVGTVLKGLVLIDYKGKVVKYMNESNGLQNNTVLSVLFDKDGNIWLGLDNGISYIELNSPLTNLYSSQNFYGAGYGAMLYKDQLYLATNRGLYYSEWPIPISEEPTQLKLIEDSQGQIWSIDSIGGDLFCSSDKGLFLIKGTEVEPVDKKTGFWSVRPMLGDPNKIWASTYDGFYVFEKENNQWKKKSYVDGYPGSAINYVEKPARNIWITGKGDLLRIKVDESLDKISESKHYAPQMGAPSGSYVYEMDDNVLFCAPSGIYNFDEKNETFALDTSFAISGQNFSAIWRKSDALWYLGPLYVRKRTKDSDVFYAHHLPLINDFERLSFLNDHEVIICNESGFSLWNADYNNQSKLHETMLINKVSISKTGDSLIYVSSFSGKKYVPEIAYKNNTIRLQYGLMSFSPHSPVKYRYELDNKTWSESTVSTIKEYSNLPEGKHIFKVEASLEVDTHLTDEFAFVILPPWYRTAWAYGVYFVLFVCVLIAIWKWDDQRIKKKKKQIESSKQKELMEKEQQFKEETEKKEQEIVELKNEHLELEVKHKSQELANIAINLVSKNEILTEIKSDLSKLSDDLRRVDKTSELRRNILRLNNKIDENIQQDDNFKKFEEHFDLVHDNFMYKLLEKYPELSLSERKMCAFIKMHLSSKEIAPLLNISVRGVETLRYRLRKKFDIDREDSLNSFLNSL